MGLVCRRSGGFSRGIGMGGGGRANRDRRQRGGGASARTTARESEALMGQFEAEQGTKMAKNGTHTVKGGRGPKTATAGVSGLGSNLAAQPGKKARGEPKAGLTVERRFTQSRRRPARRRSSTSAARASSPTPTARIVFKMDGAEIPAGWTQLATDIVVSKYFRKAGVHGDNEPRRDQRPPGRPPHRAHHPRRRARSFGGYFATQGRRRRLRGRALATSSSTSTAPSTRRSGSTAASGTSTASTGSGGNWPGTAAKPGEADAIVETTNAYERPQCSACFIQSVDDDLMSIYELVKNEARLFKYGSGTGTNFCHHPRPGRRSSRAAARSSGLMSFLEVFDRAAGATKSGGTTRRAAKMVCLDMDHPEIDDFINWKVREEKKAHALIAGGLLDRLQRRGLPHHQRPELEQLGARDRRLHARRADGRQVADDARARTGEVVRRPTTPRTSGSRSPRRPGRCADPGVQYDTTINRWHTCPNTDRINASATPAPSTCSSTTRRATSSSLNLTKFLARPDGSFDVEGYRHAVPHLLHGAGDPRRLLELPDRAPSRKNSHDYRPLGLGYANLGTLLMLLASLRLRRRAARRRRRSRPSCAGTPTTCRPRWPRRKGPFAGFAKNREPMLRVMSMHRDAAYGIDRDQRCPRRDALPRRLRRTGTTPSRLGDASTATATRRPRCSRPPAPSACSWTATPPASSPTSRS